MKNHQWRLGDYAKDELTNELLVVDLITKTDVTFYVVNRKKYPLPDGWKAGPITLTREHLFKFGFLEAQMEGDTNLAATYWVKGGVCFYENHFTKKFHIKFGEAIGTIQNEIIFDKVHELQQIYSFTGDELKLGK